MTTVNITINHMPMQVPAGITILKAAKMANIDIPYLCYHPDQSIRGHCRICSVEVVGSRKLMTACSTAVWEGMTVFTNTPKVIEAQKGILEMILANHDQQCLTCSRNQQCELQKLSERFNIKPTLSRLVDHCVIDQENPSIVRHSDKCIKCGRCVKVCEEVQGVSALTYAGRSHHFTITTAFNKPLSATDCILCGQCSAVCPVGAIVEKDDTDKAWSALADDSKQVVVQVAPAVRVALAEAFGLDNGQQVVGKMVHALRKLGFDQVFDTVFAADVTIMEEGYELLDRLNNQGTLPMITSCSPGWVNYMEKHYPDYLDHLSTTKSPQQIFGALAKTYYAETVNKAAKDIVTVSIMPCTAKKFEASRPEMGRDGIQDVDIVLTTREFIHMIRSQGIDFKRLEEQAFDELLGTGTGAGIIFGATGGVMEAALRTVSEKVTGKVLDHIDFHDVRGFEGIKEAKIELNGQAIKIAVAHGLKNASYLMEQLSKGDCPYTFIEIMACPGGCIGGGGQPIGTTWKERKERAKALYALDLQAPWRKSHDNPAVKTVYAQFLGEPLGRLSHQLLHTHYHKQSNQ